MILRGTLPSCPRRLASSIPPSPWMPAYAGMTQERLTPPIHGIFVDAQQPSCGPDTQAFRQGRGPRASMWWHPCGCPHTQCRCGPTPIRCRPDSENARRSDANPETSTGRMAPCGHTGDTAGSDSNMSCRPSWQTLRKIDLRRISALSISLHWRMTCTRYRDTTTCCNLRCIGVRTVCLGWMGWPA